MKHSIQTTHLNYFPSDTNIALLFLFWILVLAGDTFRRLPLTVSLDFWVVLPPLLFPRWVQYWNVWDLFLWAKTISLIPIAVIWCSIVRLGIDNDSWTQWGTFAVLSVNILEAITKDALSKREGETWNKLNALSGILLILSELPTAHTARISNVGGMRDFIWEQGPCWIIGEFDKYAPRSTSSHSL